jgi:hypothetical protein
MTGPVISLRHSLVRVSEIISACMILRYLASSLNQFAGVAAKNDWSTSVSYNGADYLGNYFFDNAGGIDTEMGSNRYVKTIRSCTSGLLTCTVGLRLEYCGSPSYWRVAGRWVIRLSLSPSSTPMNPAELWFAHRPRSSTAAIPPSRAPQPLTQHLPNSLPKTPIPIPAPTKTSVPSSKTADTSAATVSAPISPSSARPSSRDTITRFMRPRSPSSGARPRSAIATQRLKASRSTGNTGCRLTCAGYILASV